MSFRQQQRPAMAASEKMGHVPPKSPKETPISTTPRSTLWKRLGRRNSKSSLQVNTNPGAPLPLEHEKGHISAATAAPPPPMEADNGDGRSLTNKRAQRMARKGGLMRKFRNSFRNSEQREDMGATLQELDPATVASNRLHSPAYTAEDSLLSAEVRRTKRIHSLYVTSSCSLSFFPHSQCTVRLRRRKERGTFG
jgi:hypothetical protein